MISTHRAQRSCLGTVSRLAVPSSGCNLAGSWVSRLRFSCQPITHPLSPELLFLCFLFRPRTEALRISLSRRWWVRGRWTRVRLWPPISRRDLSKRSLEENRGRFTSRIYSACRLDRGRRRWRFGTRSSASTDARVMLFVDASTLVCLAFRRRVHIVGAESEAAWWRCCSARL